MQICGFSNESFVDGPGIRVVLFVQGCDNACPHCHNPESWDVNSGDEVSPRDVIKMIKTATKRGNALSHASSKAKTAAITGVKVRGVTFSGGEPFMQAGELVQVAGAVKKLGLDITTYTGHTYEELLLRDDEATNALLGITDFLVDGPYVHELRDISLKFRGSTNQRIIDMKKTRESGTVVLYTGQ